MAGVARRLVDQMQYDETQIGRTACAARRIERRGPDVRVGGCRPGTVSGDNTFRGHLRTWIELRLLATGRLTAHDAIDPPPLEVREVIHDAEERNELSVRRPS